jgi:hypothetical protein
MVQNVEKWNETGKLGFPVFGGGKGSEQILLTVGAGI